MKSKNNENTETTKNSNQTPEKKPSSSKKKKEKLTVESVLKFYRGGIKELWHDPNGEPYITIHGTGGLENHLLDSEDFHLRMKRVAYVKKGVVLTDHELEQVLVILSAEARFDGKEYPVFVRYAYYAPTNAIYVDLGSPTWEAVEIDENGYRITKEVPIKFIRSPGMAPLPIPEENVEGKELLRLKDVLNLPEDNYHTFLLLLIYLIGAFNPAAIYLILILNGEQGSGKSTTARLLGRLIDPSTVPTMSTPRKEEDLIIAGDIPISCGSGH